MDRRPEAQSIDTSRERVVDLLKERFADGELTLDELSRRVEIALTAPSASQLDELTTDITPAPPATLAPPSRAIVGIFGSNKRRGRWRLAPRTTIVSVFGSCKVDFREAVASGTGDVEIRVTSVFGTSKLTVPRGMRVEVDGLPVFSTHKIYVDEQPLADLPTIRVRATTVFGTLKIRPG